jgi:hypothetical protein
VPPRVSVAVPEIKLIVLLRNPIDRAYSHYWHQVSRGFEQLTFEEAIKRETSRTEKYGEEPRGSWERHHHSYLARGVYADQLSMWMDLFPKDRFFIEKSERLFAHPAAVVGELFQFLGLPDERGGSFPVLNANSSGKMDPTTRQTLADYFRPHNERLHRLLGRDLGWTEPAGVA